MKKNPQKRFLVSKMHCRKMYFRKSGLLHINERQEMFVIGKKFLLNLQSHNKYVIICFTPVLLFFPFKDILNRKYTLKVYNVLIERNLQFKKKIHSITS